MFGLLVGVIAYSVVTLNIQSGITSLTDHVMLVIGLMAGASWVFLGLY